MFLKVVMVEATQSATRHGIIFKVIMSTIFVYGGKCGHNSYDNILLREFS